jgi:hypothetical protein
MTQGVIMNTSFLSWLFLLMMSMPVLEGKVHSIFLPKPQGYYQNNFLRPQHEHQPDQDFQQGIFSAIVAYRHSLKPESIAAALFGNSVLQFTGSEVLGRDSCHDLLADYFGLAPDFQGSLFMHPTLQTITFDFSYHLDLSNWCESLFLEIAAPLVHTRWSLNACEVIIDRGMSTFPVGYMSASADNTAASLQEALQGTFNFGDMRTPWRSGSFVFGAQDLTRVADVSLALGADFFHTDCSMFQGALLTLAPAGNKFNPATNFHPVIGNGDRWEFGFILRGSYHHTWNEFHTIRFLTMGTFTHPFDIIQRRMFDLSCRGPLSRYMLLKQEALSNGMYSYASQLIHAINFSTRPAQIGCQAQGDVTFQLSYEVPRYFVDLGYNFYGRTPEKAHMLRHSAPCEVQGNHYAFKGTEGVYYRTYAVDPITNIVTNEITPLQTLNSSQITTISTGGPLCSPQSITPPNDAIILTWNSNSNNDNIIGQNATALTTAPTYQAPLSSNPPCLLTKCDINACSGLAPVVEVHTIFARIGYHGHTCGTHVRASVGATGEFGRYGTHDALFQWGVWSQITVQF